MFECYTNILLTWEKFVKSRVFYPGSLVFKCSIECNGDENILISYRLCYFLQRFTLFRKILDAEMKDPTKCGLGRKRAKRMQKQKFLGIAAYSLFL